VAEPTPQELRLNIEGTREDMAVLKLKQDKDSLVLYGSKDADVHFPGMVEDVEILKAVIKNINGMPQQVKELSDKVDCLIETDRKRVNFIRGAIAGYGLQAGGLIAVLIKVFS